MSIFDVQFQTLGEPSAGDGERVSLRDLEGSVVVMIAEEYIASLETANGVTDCVKCKIHDITSSKTYEDQLIFARVIVNGLKDKIGSPVLGVVSKGAAKPGKSSPWVLTTATEAQKAAAADYMAKL
jgi:hypothetical protein